MKRIYCAMVFTFFAQTAIAQTLYVPTVHILTTTGEYQTLVLAGFEDGVGLIECRMRIDAWEEGVKEINAAAMAIISEQGFQAGMMTSCEPKN